MSENTIQIFGIQVNIDPVAFTIPVINWKVYWYGIIIALGFILAIIYCFKRAGKFGVDSDKLLNCVLVTAPLAIICARLYYVVFNPDTSFAQFFNIHQGGLAIYGGVIGAVVIGIICCKIWKANILSTLDLASLGFLIGQGIGRWGNFVNQEAYGAATNSDWFGMTGGKIALKMGDGVLVHPCFLYESVWCLLGFLLLHFISKKRKFDGELGCFYLIWYGFGRMIIEGFRTDSLPLGSFRVSQILSALMVIAGLILLIIGLKKVNDRKKDSEYSPVFSDNSENEVTVEPVENIQTDDLIDNNEEDNENGTDN